MDSRFYITGAAQPSRQRKIGAALLAAAAFGLYLFADNGLAGRQDGKGDQAARLDLWISPPAYTQQSPVELATPAGIAPAAPQDFPSGSIVSARIDGIADAEDLRLRAASKDIAFTRDAQGSLAASAPLAESGKVSVRNGWHELASWTVNVLPDAPPAVAWTDKPQLIDGKEVRLPFRAQDPIGLADLTLRVTPHNPQPGADNTPVDIALAAPAGKETARADMLDIATQPWGGQVISVQIVATNLAGKTSLSDPHDFKLPERTFTHPVARMLIEVRNRLMQRPDDAHMRAEVANIMAAMAFDAGTRSGDPLVLMAMRSGAVRLLLGNNREAAIAANNLLWQTAAHIEGDRPKQNHRALRDSGQNMAAAH